MKNQRKGFTIIELLVVVSIIALLIGILLPAIGKARDQAHLTRSQSNLRQLVVAHNTYAAEWNDNQWTLGPHNLVGYSNGTQASAVTNYAISIGDGNPEEAWSIAIDVGFVGGEGSASYWFIGPTIRDFNMFMPIGLGESTNRHFGNFRMQNVVSFNSYLSGKFYDPVFFAPKDRAVLAAVGECLDQPGGCITTGAAVYWPSYVLSPAAGFNPGVMTAKFWNDNDHIWNSPAALRTPTMSQARYADLKTHITEHHWLQNSPGVCHPNFAGGYEGCQPYMFNHSVYSVPQTAFYDGHIAGLGMQDVWRAHQRIRTQSPGSTGLWLTSELSAPWNTGYYENQAYPIVGEAMSPHILTTGGIQGRDAAPQ